MSRGRGVMLVELAAAALVFSIAVTGYFGIQAVKQRNITAARALWIAQEACVNKLEELRALPAGAIGQMAGSRFAVKGLESTGRAGGEVTVKEYKELWEVLVEVKWESRGRNKDFKLWTYLPKEG